MSVYTSGERCPRLARGYEKFPGCICWRPVLAENDCKPFIAVSRKHWADTCQAWRNYFFCPTANVQLAI